MSTKFLIGSSEFYDTEEEAEEILQALLDSSGIAEETFVIVRIDKLDS